MGIEEKALLLLGAVGRPGSSPPHPSHCSLGGVVFPSLSDPVDGSKRPLFGRRLREWVALAARIFRVLVVLCVMATVSIVTYSYTRALAYPGQASISVKTIDWMRDHGAGPVVDVAENWWYSQRHDAALPGTPTPAKLAVGPDSPAALPRLGGMIDGREGRWADGPAGKDGKPDLYATYLRPDPEDPEVLAAVARFDQRRVGARLIAGTREPDAQPWPEGGQVPFGLRSALVATFNSGFKVEGSRGGYYTRERLVRTLQAGAASLVIDDTGHVVIGAWGRDAHIGPHIASVRQNLSLIVDGGKPVPGLDTNTDNRWGTAKNQLQYTWRSAVGVDDAGHIFYVAGDQLNLKTLARAVAATGATRGMELDIHPQMVHLFYYRQVGGVPQPIKLLDSMRGPADRYLLPDQRDFFAIVRR